MINKIERLLATKKNLIVEYALTLICIDLNEKENFKQMLKEVLRSPILLDRILGPITSFQLDGYTNLLPNYGEQDVGDEFIEQENGTFFNFYHGYLSKSKYEYLMDEYNRDGCLEER